MLLGASTLHSRVSIKYQNRSSIRFLLQKIISGYHTFIRTQKIVLCTLQILENMLDTHNISRTVIEHFLKRFEDSSAKSQKVIFQSKFIVILLSECYKIFNITAKKVLLKITLNSIQIALEKFLYHFVKCCGYLTCFLGCTKYLV